MGSGDTYTALTTIVTKGSQANGETGLKIWIIGLTASFSVLLNPTAILRGMARQAATRKPLITVTRLVKI